MANCTIKAAVADEAVNRLGETYLRCYARVVNARFLALGCMMYARSIACFGSQPDCLYLAVTIECCSVGADLRGGSPLGGLGAGF